jgi:hypothetical protein
MNKDQKVLDLITEYEAEAARCTRMAQALRGALSGAVENSQGKHVRSVVIGPTTRMHTNGEQVSTLAASINVLADHRKPMHIKDLVPMVSNLRGMETPRASIESVLVRAIKDKKHGIRRTAPGTFAVER